MNPFWERIKQFELKSLLRGLLWFALIIGLLSLTVKLAGTENLQSHVERFGAFGPALYILIKMSTIIVAPIGGSPLYVAAIPLFGFTNALIYAFIADTAAYIIVFYLSRRYGQKIVKRMIPEKAWSILEKVLYRLGTWRGLVGVRLVLIGMGDMISYAAGLTAIPFKHYFWVTLPFIITNILFFTLLGHFIIEYKWVWLVILALLACAGLFILFKPAKQEGVDNQTNIE